MIHLSKVALILDIDGVIRDVAGSYRRALADTVEHFTDRACRPSPKEIDDLKAEGIWNNDWEASQELIKRYFQRSRQPLPTIHYAEIVAYFQSRYRGTDLINWNGYIASEPLIATPEYFQRLSAAGIGWGFFSGATRASATYVLNRLAITETVLVAMEDAPGKPDPTGLLMAIAQLEAQNSQTFDWVLYAGDTSADMLSVQKAKAVDTSRQYVGVGIIPPHVPADSRSAYTDMLKEKGATFVLESILELTADRMQRELA
jgi:HAD superfamily phosphatase